MPIGREPGIELLPEAEHRKLRSPKALPDRKHVNPGETEDDLRSELAQALGDDVTADTGLCSRLSHGANHRVGRS